MSEISALNSSLLGIQKGLAGMRKNASDIARAGSTDAPLSAGQLTSSIVSLKENELQVKASAKVLKAVDETIGSLFSDKA